MAESSPNVWKTLWQEEKLHSVFKRLLLHTCKNHGWFGKGLKVDSSESGQRYKHRYMTSTCILGVRARELRKICHFVAFVNRHKEFTTVLRRSCAQNRRK